VGRRRSMGEAIELEYNGRTLLFREDMDEWSCHEVKLKAKFLSALKRKVDKLDSTARRVSLPVIQLGGGFYAKHGAPATVVMIAKRTDWENLRFDEKPDKLAGLHDRRVPTVWLMVPNGNHPPERRKARLDECALPSESVTIALREAEQLKAEAARLSKEADAIIAAIPRVTIDDLTGKVAEDDLED
jgi:hypothetical protein